MNPKIDLINPSEPGNNTVLVAWSDRYATGIECIDNQHMQLVILTNKLYQACLSNPNEVQSVFGEAMSQMVEYVRFHFTSELELLKQVNFSGYADHKSQHDGLVHKIIEASREYGAGKKFIPNHFVRTLKDWVFGHIAISDKIYSANVFEQERKGLLKINELTCSVYRPDGKY